MCKAMILTGLVLLLGVVGCNRGGKQPELTAQQLEQKTNFLKGNFDENWEKFQRQAELVGAYMPGSQPFRDEYMLLVEARDRARSAGREYHAFLESINAARPERKRVTDALTVLDRMEQDIPYR